MSKTKNQTPLLESADKSKSPLNYAVNLQSIAAEVGFDWPNTDGVIAKIREELEEVIVEIPIEDNQHRLLDEMGDLLFACISLARHLNIDPEQALKAGNQKFYRRFNALEQRLRQQNKTFNDMTVAQLEQLWEQVKRQ